MQHIEPYTPPAYLIDMSKLIGESIGVELTLPEISGTQNQEDKQAVSEYDKELIVARLKHRFPGADFGYDAKAWLKYALQNDHEFLSQVHWYYGVHDTSVYLEKLLNRELQWELRETQRESRADELNTLSEFREEWIRGVRKDMARLEDFWNTHPDLGERH